MTYRALQNIYLINLYNELLRWPGTTYLQKKTLINICSIWTAL